MSLEVTQWLRICIKTFSDVSEVTQWLHMATLSSEPHWYNLGIILQLPSHELNRIGLEHRSEGTLRCLIEVYNSLESLNKVPTWEFLSQALRRINNIALSNEWVLTLIRYRCLTRV